MPISSLISGNGKVHPERIYTYSEEMIGIELSANNVPAPAGTAWASEKAASYIPLKIQSTITVKVLYVDVSATGTLATIDMGLYNSAGTRLASVGATAVAGTGWIAFNITDTVLIPGLYYVGVVADWATTPPSVFRYTIATGGVLSCYFTETTATAALPATATFATGNGVYIPLIAISTGTLAL